MLASVEVVGDEARIIELGSGAVKLGGGGFALILSK